MEDNVNIDTKILKILIADDDDVSHRLLEKGLRIFCKEIMKASNGKDAVEIVRNNPDIDLIMMDIQMPVMNGIDAVKQIRSFNKEVVIVAQTAYALSWDKELALEAGCNEYISKPIMKMTLHDLISHFFPNIKPIAS